MRDKRDAHRDVPQCKKEEKKRRQAAVQIRKDATETPTKTSYSARKKGRNCRKAMIEERWDKHGS